MKFVAALLLASLAGCASKPIEIAHASAPAIPTQAVDARCFNYAKYARAIANLREMGMPQSGIPVTDAKHTFPIYVVQSDVYQHPEISPIRIEARHLGFCILSGYEKLVENLRTDEYSRIAKIQKELQTAELAATVQQMIDTKVLRQAEPIMKTKRTK